MTAEGSQGARATAAQLLVRERARAAIEAGEDALVAGEEPGGQHALLTKLVQGDPARFGLVFVPDVAHTLCALALHSGGRASAVVPPDMPETERRDLGIALRNQTIQLVAVTPERLAQPKFIQFIRSQSPALVAVASCQRVCAERADYYPPYESLRALRALFPSVPVLALTDGEISTGEQATLRSALSLHLEGTTAPPAMPPSAMPTAATSTEDPPPATRATHKGDEHPEGKGAGPDVDALPAEKPVESPPPTQNASPPSHPVADSPRRPLSPSRPPRSRQVSEPEGAREAFPLFERECPVGKVADQLGRDERWAYGALTAYIRDTGRPHPFPWVDKPTYMAVSMAAGQAETTDPRLVRSLLGDRVDERAIPPILAALENRQQGAGPG